jgi:hypothetical protein
LVCFLLLRPLATTRMHALCARLGCAWVFGLAVFVLGWVYVYVAVHVPRRCFCLRSACKSRITQAELQPAEMDRKNFHYASNPQRTILGKNGKEYTPLGKSVARFWNGSR